MGCFELSTCAEENIGFVLCSDVIDWPLHILLYNYKVSIKYFPDYKHLLEGNFTLRLRRVSAVDNFPTIWYTSTLGFTCSSVFGCNISKQVDWERCSGTLATTIAGYHPP